MVMVEGIVAGANVAEPMVFVLGVLPALVWSLLKEERFVRRTTCPSRGFCPLCSASL